MRKKSWIVLACHQLQTIRDHRQLINTIRQHTHQPRHQEGTKLTNPTPELISWPARLLAQRTGPLQPRIVDIEATVALGRAGPAAGVDLHRLPGRVEDSVGDGHERPGEVVAEVEDLVLVGDASGVAVRAVEEADGGFVLGSCVSMGFLESG